jgi:hypothetical protein
MPDPLRPVIITISGEAWLLVLRCGISRTQLAGFEKRKEEQHRVNATPLKRF